MLSATLSVLLSFQNVLASDEWSYSNQAAWSSSYCGSSFTTQSPIHIQTSSLSTCPSTNKLDWSLEADPEKLTYTATNHHEGIKISLIPDDGEIENDSFFKLKNNFKDSYGSDHGDYCLDSFHMHWNSEHTIDGQRDGLEIHFVHFSCNYDTLAKAIAAGEAMSASDKNKYTLAVVAVLFEEGAENSFLKAITDKISSLKVHGASIPLSGVDVQKLYPTINDETEYYHYRGSLTTPPCTPIVSWHILKEKMTISTTQMAQLATIISATTDTFVTANWRDVTANGITNVNKVYSCKKV